VHVVLCCAIGHFVTDALQVPYYYYYYYYYYYGCEQLAQSCCLTVERLGIKPATFHILVQHHQATRTNTIKNLLQQ